MKGKILIADDETRIRILVKDYLEDDGYTVFEAKNGEEVLDNFNKHPDIRLFILDVMMPKLNGFDVLKSIRPLTRAPILMLTALTTSEDELKGFKLGVDDYVKKPFSPSVLTARVNALFSRIYANTPELKRGDLTFHFDEYCVSLNGIKLDLSAREFALLTYLAENEGMVLSRDQILYKVWGYDYEGTLRTIDTHMNRLRNKLSSCESYIQTVRGFGYRFKTPDCKKN